MTDKLEQLIAHYVSAHSPTERWQAGECGVGTFSIDSAGRWFHQGDEIKRLALVRLFASVLSCEQGEYTLKTPSETCTVTVEESPFIIVAWHVSEVAQQYDVEPTIICEDNLGRLWPICKAFPLYMTEYKGLQVPHLQLNYGLCARIERNVYYQWAEIAKYNEQRQSMTLHSAGQAYELT
ncbi:DUF1285 domain-containing protein [Pseudoalteromonas luteoviolacea]|uniref:DUF1285 domain-containing protein n=1 Tax=Pseudoalteromonas luteoviolacea H33 TaxID=1365251 RepID=A0A167DM42_9GAMM|nr:DUF1285 domain-containing protein [Pseudoalteromonas luteoviolacea]KZN49022.1 hypothetical protein N476_02950 [Pseudoalteromonas luteoviolacea H33]KZN74304.1 hypothetical protein N477_01975 [Pseudoalteromonas luteoviolacea H33-S]MBQ4878516.1 DUF1285 domain-containing protein [Pseudoalteromonas luteoviolacea]MBQ4907671.1 DUF1285 domain-containing protein [Pseudoalteromonas luteoviolacea]